MGNIGMCPVHDLYKMGPPPLHFTPLPFAHSPRIALACLQLSLAPTDLQGLPVTMANISAATPVFCLLGLVVAIASMAAGANALNCNTNGASPTQGDANEAVQFIRNLGNSQCCQFNCGGDFCTVMRQNNGARVLICGDCNKCTTCSTAGGALNNVLAQCTRNVGGTARVSGNENADGFAFVIDIARGVTNAIGDAVNIEMKTSHE